MHAMHEAKVSKRRKTFEKMGLRIEIILTSSFLSFSRKIAPHFFAQKYTCLVFAFPSTTSLRKAAATFFLQYESPQCQQKDPKE